MKFLAAALLGTVALSQVYAESVSSSSIADESSVEEKKSSKGSKCDIETAVQIARLRVSDTQVDVGRGGKGCDQRTRSRFGFDKDFVYVSVAPIDSVKAATLLPRIKARFNGVYAVNGTVDGETFTRDLDGIRRIDNFRHFDFSPISCTCGSVAVPQNVDTTCADTLVCELNGNSVSSGVNSRFVFHLPMAPATEVGNNTYAGPNEIKFDVELTGADIDAAEYLALSGGLVSKDRFRNKAFEQDDEHTHRTLKGLDAVAGAGLLWDPLYSSTNDGVYDEPIYFIAGEEKDDDHKEGEDDGEEDKDVEEKDKDGSSSSSTATAKRGDGSKSSEFESEEKDKGSEDNDREKGLLFVFGTQGSGNAYWDPTLYTPAPAEEDSSSSASAVVASLSVVAAAAFAALF
jgi:hypothetical protein